MSRIGIYGGSFNPFHYGHLNVARQVLAELALDRLLVIPANVSPFKTDGVADDSELLRSTRLSRIRASFADEPRVTVDEREMKRGGVSYTIDTVREIAAENPGAELFLIVGEDSVAGLPRWKDYETLKTLCTIKAYPRTVESSSEIRRLFAAGGVTLNPDARMAQTVENGVIRKNGFCPCRLPKLAEFFCPCDEFKGQLADPDYHGLCHCRLYLKP